VWLVADEPSLRIVELNADHLPDVLEIEKASFRDPWTLQAFRNFIILYRTNWVAMRDEKVVGYLITQWVLDEIHILNIAVRREFRRQGVAAELLNFLFQSGAGRRIKSVYLEVRESNDAARTLYAKFGFSELGIRKSYYQDGENALVMHRRMKPSDGDTAQEGE
jgi:ribosomal-protein-alanine acetyltransferase